MCKPMLTCFLVFVEGTGFVPPFGAWLDTGISWAHVPELPEGPREQR